MISVHSSQAGCKGAIKETFMNLFRISTVCCLALALLAPCPAAAQVPPKPIGERPKPIAEPAQNPEQLAELGRAEYQAQNFENAFFYYQIAIRKISPAGFAKKEWLETFGILCAKLNKREDFIDTMRQMVLLYPSVKKPVEELQKYSGNLEPLMKAPDYSKKAKQFPPLRDEAKQAFSSARAALESGKHAEAVSIAETALLNAKFNSYERAMIWTIRGNIYLSQQHSVLGAYAFEQALRQRDVPNELLQKMNHLLGGTYFRIGKYDLAIDRLNKSLGPGLSPQEEQMARGALCEAHAQLKHYAQATDICEQLVTAAKKQSVPPEDKLLRTLRTVYFESDNPINELRMLKLLRDPTGAEQQRLAELETSVKKKSR
jgi:tetratricopeptide (TPR) repeat protein